MVEPDNQPAPEGAVNTSIETVVINGEVYDFAPALSDNGRTVLRFFAVHQNTTMDINDILSSDMFAGYSVGDAEDAFSDGWNDICMQYGGHPLRAAICFGILTDKRMWFGLNVTEETIAKADSVSIARRKSRINSDLVEPDEEPVHVYEAKYWHEDLDASIELYRHRFNLNGTEYNLKDYNLKQGLPFRCAHRMLDILLSRAGQKLTRNDIKAAGYYGNKAPLTVEKNLVLAAKLLLDELDGTGLLKTGKRGQERWYSIGLDLDNLERSNPPTEVVPNPSIGPEKAVELPLVLDNNQPVNSQRIVVHEDALEFNGQLFPIGDIKARQHVKDFIMILQAHEGEALTFKDIVSLGFASNEHPDKRHDYAKNAVIYIISHLGKNLNLATIIQKGRTKRGIAHWYGINVSEKTIAKRTALLDRAPVKRGPRTQSENQVPVATNHRKDKKAVQADPPKTEEKVEIEYSGNAIEAILQLPLTPIEREVAAYFLTEGKNSLSRRAISANAANMPLPGDKLGKIFDSINLKAARSGLAYSFTDREFYRNGVQHTYIDLY